MFKHKEYLIITLGCDRYLAIEKKIPKSLIKKKHVMTERSDEFGNLEYETTLTLDFIYYIRSCILWFVYLCIYNNDLHWNFRVSTY
jgi:hypothetical protein